MKFPGFIGHSGASTRGSADSQRLINLYLEANSPGGKGPATLYGTPGRSEFAIGLDGPVRALFSVPQLFPGTDRVFAVAGAKFYELLSDGTATERGTVANDGYAAFIDANPTQLFITSYNTGYLFNLTTNAFTGPIFDVDGTQLTPSGVVFIDGYFVASLGGQNFGISALYDGSSWDALDFGAAEGAPDLLSRIIVNRRELWAFGAESIQVFVNTGNPDFPFEAAPGGMIQKGCMAPASVYMVNEHIYWIGGDPKEGPAVYRAVGYQAQRISNHQIEEALRTYGGNVSLAWCYGYMEDGHEFYVMVLPEVNATWVYDATTGGWHERLVWNPRFAKYVADRGRVHVRGFNKHLVGDRSSGVIYEQSLDILDDAGCMIRRVRRAPHLSDDMTWTIYHRMQVDFEVGLGLVSGQGSDPQAALRWSNDGGKNFGPERVRSVGKIGKYKTRAIWNYLGKSRDRVFELILTDPIKWVVLDAFLDLSPGMRG